MFIFHAGLPPMVQEMIGDALASFQQEAQNLLPALQSALAEIAAVPRLLVDLLVAAIATFFISRDRPQLGRFFMRFMPPPWREGLQRVQQNLLLSSLRYLRAQAILISVTTILSILGLWAIGAPFALSMGLLAGIADALPVLGPALVFLPWSIFHIFMGERIFGLLLLLLFSVLAITRQLLEPKVVGDSLGLHPLAVLAGMYLGVKVFGVAGIVFGPLLALLLRVMVEAGLLPIFPDYGENEPPSDKPAGPPSPPRA
ncbi:MAG: sporulation integral membrane protein YtvI [Thermaerobacterales bacterium]